MNRCISLCANATLLFAAVLVIVGCLPPQPVVDCIWDGVARAWLDENQNGTWDSHELPLPGVPFYVDDTWNSYAKVAEYVTSNIQGDAHLLVWLPGCPKTEFEVYPEVLAGYKLTTEESIFARDRADGEPFNFGFTYLPGVPTATPRPNVPMTCTSYSLVGEHEHGIVEHLVVASDGAVWGETIRELFRFDRKSDVWTTFDTTDGLPSTSIDAMSVTADGILWISTYEGPASFDGITWKVYSTADGLLSNRINNIATTVQGDVWFVSAMGVSRLTRGEITTYTLEVKHPTEYLDYGTVAPNGSLWLVSSARLFQLVITDDEKRQPIWTAYSYPEYGVFSISSRQGVVISPNGTLWFIGSIVKKGGGLASYNPSTEEWTVYNHKTTNRALLGETITDFALAGDNSFWLGTFRNGVIHLFPAPDGQTDEAQVIYHIEPLLLEQEIRSIALAPDGAVWLGVQGNIIRCMENTG